MKPAEFRPAEKYDTNPYYDTTEWPGYVEPTGTIEITENGEVDVTQYAKADVSVEASGGGGGTNAHKLYVYAEDYSLTGYTVGFDIVSADELQDATVQVEGNEVQCKVFPTDIEAGEVVTVTGNVVCLLTALEHISNTDITAEGAFAMPKCDTFVFIQFNTD